MRQDIGRFVLHEIVGLAEHRCLEMVVILATRLLLLRLLLLLLRLLLLLLLRLLRRRRILRGRPRGRFTRVRRRGHALALDIRVSTVVVITGLAVIIVALLLLRLIRPLCEEILLVVSQMNLETLVALEVKAAIFTVVLRIGASSNVLLLLLLLLLYARHLTHIAVGWYLRLSLAP